METSVEKLIWTALDAPRLEPNNWDLFWEKWNQHAGPSYIKGIDPRGNRDPGAAFGQRTDFFKGLNIYTKDQSSITNGYWELPFLDYKEIFPNLLDDIYAACPWVNEVTFARLWRSNRQIGLHRDYDPNVVALRSMIYDENNKPTFKVVKPGVANSYVDLPKDGTNWFAYNNSACLHGSDKTKDVNKIILLILYRCDDKSKMLDHFRSSREKYPNHCLYC